MTKDSANIRHGIRPYFRANHEQSLGQVCASGSGGSRDEWGARSRKSRECPLRTVATEFDLNDATRSRAGSSPFAPCPGGARAPEKKSPSGELCVTGSGPGSTTSVVAATLPAVTSDVCHHTFDTLKRRPRPSLLLVGFGLGVANRGQDVVCSG